MSTISAGTTVTTALVASGDTTGALTFQVNGTTTAATITTAGNLGIGTTSPGYRLDTQTATSITQARFSNSATGGATITSTAGSQAIWAGGTEFNGTAFVARATTSSQIRTDGGLVTFFTNDSLTSGNTFTPSERMRIDSSGNVGIGTATTGSRVRVVSGANVNAPVLGSVTNYPVFLSNTDSAYGLGIGVNASDGHVWLQAQRSDSAATAYNITLNEAGGNVGIGTASPNGKVEIADNTSQTNDTLRLYNLNSAYSQASINFHTTAQGGVGSVPTARIYATYTASGYGNQVLRFQTGDASGNYQDRMTITASGEVYIAGTTDQGAYNLQCNGTGVWGAGAYVNGSDARLKDNIQSLDSGLDVIKAMRPVTFQYKQEYSKDQSVQPGFIAQELQEAMAGKPYLEGVVQEGPNHLNVAYQNIIPILVKAMQEQQEQIKALQDKVAALESK